jgi:hypothetical protein
MARSACQKPAHAFPFAKATEERPSANAVPRASWAPVANRSGGEGMPSTAGTVASGAGIKPGKPGAAFHKGDFLKAETLMAVERTGPGSDMACAISRYWRGTMAPLFPPCRRVECSAARHDSPYIVGVMKRNPRYGLRMIPATLGGPKQKGRWGRGRPWRLKVETC